MLVINGLNSIDRMLAINRLDVLVINGFSNPVNLFIIDGLSGSENASMLELLLIYCWVKGARECIEYTWIDLCM